MTYGFGPVAVGDGTNWAAPYMASASGGYNFASPWFARGGCGNLAMPFAAWGSGGMNFAGAPFGKGTRGW